PIVVVQQTAEHVGATLAAAVNEGRLARLPHNSNLIAAALGTHFSWHESNVFNRRARIFTRDLDASCCWAIAVDGPFQNTRHAIRQIAFVLDRSWGERLKMFTRSARLRIARCVRDWWRGTESNCR